MTPSYRSLVALNADDELDDGYDPDDPKHQTWADRVFDRADQERDDAIFEQMVDDQERGKDG